MIGLEVCVAFRHMTVGLSTTIECLHTSPANMGTTTFAFHMVTSISLLDRRLTLRAIAHIVLFLPLVELLFIVPRFGQGLISITCEAIVGDMVTPGANRAETAITVEDPGIGH